MSPLITLLTRLQRAGHLHSVEEIELRATRISGSVGDFLDELDAGKRTLSELIQPVPPGTRTGPEKAEDL